MKPESSLRFHKVLPLESIFGQLNPIHTLLHLYLPNGHFPSGFPTKILCAFVMFPKRSVFPFHLTFYYLVIYNRLYYYVIFWLCVGIQNRIQTSMKTCILGLLDLSNSLLGSVGHFRKFAFRCNIELGPTVPTI
jgi:hypothetical protein